MFRNDFLFMNIFMNFHEWGLTNFRFYGIMKPEKRRKDFGMSDYTIKDIARMAGVSTGTVSRVLNGADNIAPDLYARTMEVLRSTNYLESKRRVVAAGTESKVRRMMKRICVVTPDMTAAWSGHQLWNEYLHGIENACRAANCRYEVQFASPELSPEEQAESLASSDGILMKNALDVPAFMNYLPPELPVVGFGSYNPGMTCPQIAIDNYAVGAVLTEYCLRMGHTRIAFVNHETHHKMFVTREQGYVETMRAAGLYDESLLMENKTDAGKEYSPLQTLPDMKETLAKLLFMTPRPTAVIFVNDWAAAGFYQACQGRGIAIPEVFSVCGVDNTPSICEILNPSLTSFDLPWSKVSEFAAASLLEMIDGIGRHRMNVTSVQYLGGKLVPRNSVRAIGRTAETVNDKAAGALV